MAMQSVRLRRVLTSLSSFHCSFHSPIIPAHSLPPQISIPTSLSVQPSASFRFPSRAFSWFSAFSGGKEDPSKAEEDSAVGKDDSVSKEEDDGVVLSADLDCKDNALEEYGDSTLSKDKDAEANESDDLTLPKDKDAEANESDDLILSKGKDADGNVSKEENDCSPITKDKDSEDDLSKINFADWLFSDKVLDEDNEDDADSLFKNVKPLSEYKFDDKLTEEDKDFMNIFKKYDIKEMMAKAKEQEQSNDSMKEYEGYSFMRHREEEYPYSFFEDEKPRVPKNEDDIGEIFAGCDLKHWLVTVDFPDDPEPTREEMIATYERVCAEGLGVSIEEAKKRIYSCSTTVYQGFGVEMTREESEKFIEVPEVCLVLPDSYMDRKNKEYGGDKYENGVITERPPRFTYKKKPKKDKKGGKPGHKDEKGTLPIAEKPGGSMVAQSANA